MNTNGYKIIDLGGITLDENGEYQDTITGIYDAVDSSKKPIIISGINGAKPSFMGSMIKAQTGDDTYTYTGFLGMSSYGMLIFNVENNDTVSINVAN